MGCRGLSTHTHGLLLRGETIPGGDFLMSDMPKTLQEDVKMAECQKNMDTVKFLQGIDEDFLRCLVLKTSNYLFAPGDYVLYYGDMGREMYCVRRGYVEVRPLMYCLL